MTKTRTMLAAAMAVMGGFLGTAQATTVIQQVSFSGQQAAFQFTASTSITCADGSTGMAAAFGFISGAQQIFDSTGSPQSISNGTFVEIDSYSNSCTGVFFSGDGGLSGGFTPPDKQLDSASMQGNGFVQDFGTGNTFAFSLDVSIVGSGSTSSEKSTSHSKVTGTTHGNVSISHSKSASSNRSGTATGSITVDTVTFPSFDTFFVELISNSSSSLTVSK